jgi:hypothetical protein
MKKLITISLFAALLTSGMALKAQDQPRDYLGLPGDNLNLYAVMQMFQESQTLEEFEKNLNDPNSNINNLDLNGDNLVDYLRVIDDVDGNVHNIIIQDQISQNETQDVAVFTVQRFSNGDVQIQLTGDEALYGQNYIIEPRFDNANQTPNPGYTGNSEVVNGRNVTVVTTTPVVIATWPMIRFIYSPRYVVWRSRWYWGYYPSYWHPWKPHYWDYYYGYHYNLYNNYYGYYRRVNNHRYTNWNTYYYTSRRAHSPYVYNKVHSGYYKSTYSHPDQRKLGEAAYRKTYPSQNRRSTGNNQGNNTSRRMDNGPAKVANPASTTRSTTTRRTNSTITKRADSNVKPAGNSGSNQRSTATGNNRTISERPANQSTVTHKTTQQPAVQNTVTRKTTRQSAAQNNNAHSAIQKPAKVSSKERRSSSHKAVKTTKNSDKTTKAKKSETSDPKRKR